ncbi:uncharacterized protein TNCV_3442421 [Trichonephila clavipes]|nr:uncharacterized protein TNCV_3442421 [Trichonephila clavipes]
MGGVDSFRNIQQNFKIANSVWWNVFSFPTTEGEFLSKGCLTFPRLFFSEREREKKRKRERCKMSQGIRRFLEKINDVANLGKWSNDEKVTILKLKLAGIAEEFFLSDPTHSHLTEYNDIARILIARFEKAVPLSTRLQLFSSCIQGSSESVQEFAACINKLGTQIFQSGNSAQNTAVRNANDQLLQSHFISGLRNDIGRVVLARDPVNLDESINAALIEEQNVKLNQIANDERSGLSPSQTETSVISALTNKLQEINLRVERLQEASSVTVCKTGGVPFGRRETVFKCFYCGFLGHRQADCRKRRIDGRRANYQPPGETPWANFLFFVTQALILSIGDLSISKNRLFAIITQPTGIRRAGQTRLLGIKVFNAILETTI